ncbi:hypothetical protein LBUL87_0422 [Lactobacillus delbrueckii subsp. bulgaricus]|nr:hypothetical protein LBUL87_0422 [Lactobacillus delbrueckii subsp. bulgaricus]
MISSTKSGSSLRPVVSKTTSFSGSSLSICCSFLAFSVYWLVKVVDLADRFKQGRVVKTPGLQFSDWPDETFIIA